MTTGPESAFNDEIQTSNQEEYDRLRALLNRAIGRIAEREDISAGGLALLLVDLGVTNRMLAYVLSIEKPSASGLKIDLDRFRRDVDNLMRSYKKTAEDYIVEAKEALAADDPPDQDPR